MFSRQSRFHYDVFISYAHEDEATAIWLEKYLSKAWVPGKRQRRVFRDRSELTAGQLSESLRDNLANSRFLLVCCSEAAAKSTWVNLEIDEFAHRDAPPRGHAAKFILACQVGQKSSELVLPSALRWLQCETGDEFFLPDLRGVGEDTSRPARHLAAHEAAALLAPLVDLRSRSEVIARIRKRKILIGLISFSLLALVLLIGQAWRAWLGTPEGTYYEAAELVLQAAGQRQVVEHRILRGAIALGRQGQRSRLKQFSQIIQEKQFHAILLALGLASLPNPDCSAAASELAKVDSAAARTWPDAHLVTYRRCGGTWLARAQPQELSPAELPAWTSHLVDSGNYEAAMQWLAKPDFPPKERLPLEARLAIAARKPSSYRQADIQAWAIDADALDVAYRGLVLLAEFDMGGRLADPLAEQLTDIASQAVAELDIDQADNWSLVAQLAAHLAAVNRSSESQRLLARSRRRGPPLDPAWAPGWAWRGLAFQRMGRFADALESFAAAERSLRVAAPASRDWRELAKVANIYVLANNWPAAFAVLALSGNEEIQIIQRCDLMATWVTRGGTLPWPWRFAY